MVPTNQPTNQPVTREELIDYSVNLDQQRQPTASGYQPPRSANPDLVRQTAKDLVANPVYKQAESSADRFAKDESRFEIGMNGEGFVPFNMEELELHHANVRGIVTGYCAAKNVPESEVRFVQEAVEKSGEMSGIAQNRGMGISMSSRPIPREDFEKKKAELAGENKEIRNQPLQFLDDGKPTPEIPTTKAEQPGAETAKPVPPR